MGSNTQFKSISEYHKGVKNGRSTEYYSDGQIVNCLFDRGMEFSTESVTAEKAFFDRDGHSVNTN